MAKKNVQAGHTSEEDQVMKLHAKLQFSKESEVFAF